MRRLLFSLPGLLLVTPPAAAIVGVASTTVRDTGPGRHIVMIISTRGNVCTGTAIARDLVITAGHCVAPAATYRVSTPDQPKGFDIAQVIVHPRYDAKMYTAGRVTADVALIKLAQPLPAKIAPAGLADSSNVAPGDRFTIAGYGTIAPRTDQGLGTPRAAELVATGKPGNLQIRLMDPETRDTKLGLGACTGDSGGPAFRQVGGAYQIAGIVSWSTGPAGTAGCGGLTGLTPLTLYRTWITDTARKMGAAVGG